MTRTSLLDELLVLADDHAGTEWFQANAAAFLEVCGLFGTYAAQHHDGLVRRFIESPAAALDAKGLEGITASGPPAARAHALAGDSARLCASRRIAPDIASRHADHRPVAQRRRAASGPPAESGLARAADLYGSLQALQTCFLRL